MMYIEEEPRMSYAPESNALVFQRVQYLDSGEYHCVINSQRKRAGIVRFYVQGAYFFCSIAYSTCPREVVLRCCLLVWSKLGRPT